MKNKGIQELDILIDWKNTVEHMNSQIAQSNPKSFAELKRKSRLMTPTEDMARVNPYFKESKDFNINCAYCSAAYDLRRRGFDVEADDYHLYDLRTDELVNSVTEIYSWWTHSHSGYKKFMIPEDDTKDILTYCLAQENGARGILNVVWNQGSAHCLIYEIHYGKVLIRDCQRDKTAKLEDYFNRVKRLYFFRTDNEQPTNRILLGVKNKTSDSINKHVSEASFESLIARYKKEGYSCYENPDGSYSIISKTGKIFQIDRTGTIRSARLNSLVK